ncbi:MAG: NADH-quinone oxidoreductase subunit M, partial [Phycisphaerales bacterium]|nr:NADH-quinone oxidoreductase subunit M [Phycisphaerales bacterium]
MAKGREAVRWTALVTTIITFAASLLLFATFKWDVGNGYGYLQGSGGVVQMVQRASWIKSFNIEYLVGIDGLSFPLVLLSTFICLLACIASWNIQKMTKGYMALFLFLETGILGTFLSLDFFLFYVF